MLISKCVIQWWVKKYVLEKSESQTERRLKDLPASNYVPTFCAVLFNVFLTSNFVYKKIWYDFQWDISIKFQDQMKKRWNITDHHTAFNNEQNSLIIVRYKRFQCKKFGNDSVQKTNGLIYIP